MLGLTSSLAAGFAALTAAGVPAQPAPIDNRGDAANNLLNACPHTQWLIRTTFKYPIGSEPDAGQIPRR